MNERSDSALAAWLALLLFGIYLLSYSGQFYSQDSMLMFSVAESFVKRGEYNADQMWTIYKTRGELGLDGESYSKTGYGASLFAAPMYALGLALPGDLGLLQTTILASALVIALSGALVFLSARRLKFSRRVSVLTALLFGLATPAWVYAKQFWSEPYALFTLIGAFYFLQRYRAEWRARDALTAGALLGLAVAVRVTNAALVPFYAAYGFLPGILWHRQANEFAPTESRNPPSRIQAQPAQAGLVQSLLRLQSPSNQDGWRGLIWFGATLAVIALTIAYYDWARYGNPILTGYRADETFDTPLLFGMYGLLFSPGKGLFIFAPFLAGLPFACAVFFKRLKREAILIFAVCAFYVLLFSLWYYWSGGTNWGPRFLVPILPFLVLLCAPAVELAIHETEQLLGQYQTSHRGHREHRENLVTNPVSAVAEKKRGIGKLFPIIFSLLAALSVAIQIIGVAVPALAYRARMVKLSPNPDFDAIFLPQFSPIIGSLNLLRPSVLDFAWLRVVDGKPQIDWLVIALTLIFIALCVSGLLRKKAMPLFIVLGLAIALALFSLYRYRDDDRFGGSAGYRALLQTVRQAEQPGDVMILDDDTRMLFFLNENRARMRWYGLSRDPKQWDDATRALLTRLAKQNVRIWFVYDDATAQMPDPVHTWLAQSLSALSERDFGDGVHLGVYATDVRP